MPCDKMLHIFSASKQSREKWCFQYLVPRGFQIRCFVFFACLHNLFYYFVIFFWHYTCGSTRVEALVAIHHNTQSEEQDGKKNSNQRAQDILLFWILSLSESTRYRNTKKNKATEKKRNEKIKKKKTLIAVKLSTIIIECHSQPQANIQRF